MGRPRYHAKPDLSDLSRREIRISADRQTVEMELFDWVCDIVRRTKQRPEGGRSAEANLMTTAEGSVDVLMHAPPPMSLGGSSDKRMVYAHFYPARYPDGHWFVAAVSFGLHLSAAQEHLARQQAIRERLLARAEIRHAEHVNVRKIAFPAEKYTDTWHNDIDFGDGIIKSAIERAHENAKIDAKMLENPETPAKMALDMAGPFAKGLTAEVRGSERLSEFAGGLTNQERWTYEASNMHGILGAEKLARARRLNEAREILSHGSEAAGAGRAAREHKYVEAGMELAGFIPVAGPFIKIMAGMFFELAIASDASRVAKLRSRCYIFFVAGYIGRIAMTDTGSPHTKLDRKYFELGRISAPASPSHGSFCAQISLLHYAAGHYTAGGWRGLGFKPQEWTFPDRYIVKWSPELLGRAMSTQLHTQENLLE